jgi:hypothetical protein
MLVSFRSSSPGSILSISAPMVRRLLTCRRGAASLSLHVQLLGLHLHLPRLQLLTLGLLLVCEILLR